MRGGARGELQEGDRRLVADVGVGVDGLCRAELVDRFGKLPDEAENLLQLIECKLACRRAGIAKLDVGAKGALVAFAEDTPPELPKLLAYVDRLKGTARLRPDGRLVITRDWDSPGARLNGAVQLSKGLAKALAA